ncbi:hypothetical protein D9M72_471670 [compost metagenome]
MGVAVGAAAMAEREQRETRGGDDFKVVNRSKTLGKAARPGDVVADHCLQAIQPVKTQQEPEFQRPEAPAKRDRPFGIVDDAVAAMGFQIFRLDRQGFD